MEKTRSRVQVKTFQGYTVSSVEKEVNNFLEDLYVHNKIVLDVKTNIATVKDMVYYTRTVIYS